MFQSAPHGSRRACLPGLWQPQAAQARPAPSWQLQALDMGTPCSDASTGHVPCHATQAFIRQCNYELEEELLDEGSQLDLMPPRARLTAAIRQWLELILPYRGGREGVGCAGMLEPDPPRASPLSRSPAPPPPCFSRFMGQRTGCRGESVGGAGVVQRDCGHHPAMPGRRVRGSGLVRGRASALGAVHGPACVEPSTKPPLKTAARAPACPPSAHVPPRPP